MKRDELSALAAELKADANWLRANQFHGGRSIDAAGRIEQACAALDSSQPAGEETESLARSVESAIEIIGYKENEFPILELRAAADLLRIQAQAAPSVPVRIDPENPETWPPRLNDKWSVPVVAGYWHPDAKQWIREVLSWHFETRSWAGGFAYTHWTPLPDWKVD